METPSDFCLTAVLWKTFPGNSTVIEIDEGSEQFRDRNNNSTPGDCLHKLHIFTCSLVVMWVGLKLVPLCIVSVRCMIDETHSPNTTNTND